MGEGFASGANKCAQRCHPACSDGDVVGFHLGRWKSKEKVSVVFDGSSQNLLHFVGCVSPMTHPSSQEWESLNSVHPHIMNLVLGLTRLELPFLAISPTLLRADLIVAGETL